MTETDFERELRTALSEARAAAGEPTGLADRLVTAATSGLSRPHPVNLGRSRRWLPPLLAAAAVIAVAVATGAVVTSTRADREQPTTPNPGPTTPNPGLTTPLIAPESLLEVRELAFHVEKVPGLEVADSWSIDQDGQSTFGTVLLEDGHLGLGVTVYYQGMSPQGMTAEPPSSRTPRREAVTVHGIAGTYFEAGRSDGWVASLAWEYAPNSWAEVSGHWRTKPPPDLRDELLTVAEAVRPGGNTLRVPVRFGTVPASLPSVATAHGIDMSYDGGEWLWWLSVDDISIWATSSPGGECLGSEGQPQTEEFTYRGHRGCVVAGERMGLHFGDADVFFDFGPSPELPMEDMKQLLAEMTVASDDPTTWFDLKTALGG